MRSSVVRSIAGNVLTHAHANARWTVNHTLRRWVPWPPTVRWEEGSFIRGDEGHNRALRLRIRLSPPNIMRVYDDATAYTTLRGKGTDAVVSRS
ncbi:hypothetical protein OPV22_010828 [Ensete ventricosum]|uniref:Uncharacterized protein n=1 Tax=Ensete ventricosum TaxID=4639 RepID=A0AAV8RLN5_ENSVE|nr:hypothetical protein OPV22_010828 [Ensete ventricosum]